jgi:protoporphyrinogen IX oxidase
VTGLLTVSNGAPMDLLLSLLLWVHFLGLAVGLGSGIALSQTSPRLATANEHELPLLWKLEHTFSGTTLGGLVALLVTGPLLAWLKYGGMAGMPTWFWAKMVFVLLVAVGMVGHLLAARRFRAGSVTAYRWMEIGGRTAGISSVLAVLCAVMTFD